MLVLLKLPASVPRFRDHRVRNLIHKEHCRCEVPQVMDSEMLNASLVDVVFAS
jgi:hypothetical protein